MLFRIGNSIAEVWKIKRGESIKYRSVYVGDEKIWPHYEIGSVDNSFFHIGNENSIRDYTIPSKENSSKINRGEGPFDENFLPELDPAGGTFGFDFQIRESSSWHYLSFRILVPDEIELKKVEKQINLDGKFVEIEPLRISISSKLNYTGVQNVEYQAKILNIQLDPLNEEKGEIDILDSPLRLTFEAPENIESDFKIREIVLCDFRNEMGYWNNMEEKDRTILAAYRQQPNFLYETIASWVDPNIQKNGLILPPFYGKLNEIDSASMLTVSYDKTATYVFLAIAFGISQDGGKNWYYGPPNDHLNKEGKLNKFGGHLLENISEYLQVYGTNSEITIEIGELGSYIDENGNSISDYIVPIKLSSSENDAEHNDNRTRYYAWSDEKDNEKGNTSWDGLNSNNNKLPGGNNTDDKYTSTRKIREILQINGTEARVTNLTAIFKYNKHEFELK